MKSKLGKEIILISFLGLVVSLFVNFAFQVVTDMYLDHGMTEAIISIDITGTDAFILTTQELDDLEFAMAIAVNAITTAIFGLILWLYMWKKSNYINKLSSSLIYIGEGNLKHRASVEENNELTELAENINGMVERLEILMEKEKEQSIKEREFIVGISHDVRTPLTKIIGYLHIIDEKNYENEEQKDEFTKLAIEKAYSLKNLTDLLLDADNYANNSGNILICSKNDFVDDMKLKFEDELKDDFSFTFNDHTKNFKVQLPSEIERIFSNLISNIQKYADPAETIDLSILEDKKSVQILISNKSKDIIDVRPEKLADKFYRVDKSRGEKEGYGMGLHLCKSILENNGGYLDLLIEDGRLIVLVGLNKV